MAVDAELNEQGERFGQYISEIRAGWDAEESVSSSNQVRESMRRLLVQSPPEVPWLGVLLHEKPAGRELYRDAEHGFVQMGHFQGPSHANTPHDHGPCWVVYGVYRGAMEITTYRRTDDGSVPGKAKLDALKTERLGEGDVRTYVPGDIHATRVVSEDGAIILRFLSADLERVVRSRYNVERETVVTS